MVSKRLSLFQIPKEKGGKPMSKEKKIVPITSAATDKGQSPKANVIVTENQQKSNRAEACTAVRLLRRKPRCPKKGTRRK